MPLVQARPSDWKGLGEWGLFGEIISKYTKGDLVQKKRKTNLGFHVSVGMSKTLGSIKKLGYV